MIQMWRNLRGWMILFAVIAGLYAFLHLVVLVPKPVPVRAHRVAGGVVERTISNTKAGSVRSRLSADLTSDATGRIVEVVHREGARVKAGDPILRLDDRSVKAALAVADRERENAIALQAQAKASADDAAREHRRVGGLRDEGTVSESELDKARTQVDLTAAALQSATARVNQQKARLEEIRIELEKMTLAAPFAGVITELRVEVGEWAVPGKPLVKLMDLERVYVRADLDEVDIGDLRVGLPVRMKLDPFRGRVFDGSVTRVSPYVSEALEQNRTVEIEVEFAEGTDLGPVKPGTSADVEVILERTEGSLRIPTVAIMEGNRVLVADGGFAREATIEPGLRNWDYTEVKSGLAGGALVIVSLDRQEVRAGAQIAVEKEEP